MFIITILNGACLSIDDRRLFEFLMLESAQAGLSWYRVLHKRENYRAAFDGFDPEKIAQFGDRKVESFCRGAAFAQ
jgi:DNA-3-methyladenine glycosylase I